MSEQQRDLVQNLEGAEQRDFELPRISLERNEVALVFADLESGQVYVHLFDQGADVTLRGQWHDGSGNWVNVGGYRDQPEHHGARHMAMKFTITLTDINGRILSQERWAVTGDFARFRLPKIANHVYKVHISANDHPGQFDDNKEHPDDPSRCEIRSF